MSRIGKNPLTIPAGVDVTPDGDVVRVKQGNVALNVPWFGRVMTMRREDGRMWIEPRNKRHKRNLQLWGTQWRLISSAIEGVTRGFEKTLEIRGVGLRVQLQGTSLKMQLGYSHDIIFPIPTDVAVSLSGDRNNIITVTGPDKQRVGQIASELRAFRPPEVYKGKGIRYKNERVPLKEGKKK